MDMSEDQERPVMRREQVDGSVKSTIRYFRSLDTDEKIKQVGIPFVQGAVASLEKYLKDNEHMVSMSVNLEAQEALREIRSRLNAGTRQQKLPAWMMQIMHEKEEQKRIQNYKELIRHSAPAAGRWPLCLSLALSTVSLLPCQSKPSSLPPSPPDV